MPEIPNPDGQQDQNDDHRRKARPDIAHQHHRKIASKRRQIADRFYRLPRHLHRTNYRHRNVRTNGAGLLWCGSTAPAAAAATAAAAVTAAGVATAVATAATA